MYVVVYLAPGDYHRYHSPAAFTASYRRHIAGYLEPVDPRYLKKHRDVFKSNERVNVLGDWAHGFFAMSFVGATNVGSIKLHFDDNLKTNIPNPVSPYLQDRNYAILSSNGEDNLFLTYPTRGKNKTDQEQHSIDSLLAEFDVKDVVKGDKFEFSPTLEN
jgi:phosphatidylserine decarboxylase precursor